MNKLVKDVVEGFRRLSRQEQDRAFLDIEDIWKSVPGNRNEEPGEFSDTGLPASPGTARG